MNEWAKLIGAALIFVILIFLFLKGLKWIFKIGMIALVVFLVYQAYIFYGEPAMFKSCPSDCEDSNISTIDYCSKKTNYECMHTLRCSCNDNDLCTEDVCSSETNFTCVYQEIKPC